MDGQFSTGAGINVGGVAGLDIINTNVLYFSNGLKLFPDGSWYGGVRWVSVVNSIFENHADAAILIDGFTNDLPVWGVHLIRVSGTQSLHGLHIKGSKVARVIMAEGWLNTNKRYGGIAELNARDIEILDSYIAGNSTDSTNTYDGILIKTATVVVRGCYGVRRFNETTQNRYHIYVDNASNVYILNNYLTDAGTGAIGGTFVSPYGIEGNEDYVTQNSGTATIASGTASITVAHGLASAPSIVTATGTGSDTSACWVDNIDSTNFDIGVASAVSADENVYWYAEV